MSWEWPGYELAIGYISLVLHYKYYDSYTIYQLYSSNNNIIIIIITQHDQKVYYTKH